MSFRLSLTTYVLLIFHFHYMTNSVSLFVFLKTQQIVNQWLFKKELNALIALSLSITTSVGLANSSSFLSVQLSHHSSSIFQYAQAKGVGNPLAYHLSSDEPWRATVAISDATTMLAGYNNTDIIDKAVIGRPEILSNLLSRATVIDY
jgi:hypothetical protein